MSKSETITRSIVDSHGPELIESIVEHAESMFREAGVESDFCLQTVSPCRIVFGSVNRVVWTAKYGFQLGPVYCTSRFWNRWKELNPQ